MRLLPLALLSLGGVAAAACSDPNDLADATIANAVDTVEMFALRGTPVTTPSAFSVALGRAVRIDQTSSFDFAFDFTGSSTATDGQPIFLPLGIVGLGSGTSSDPGLQNVPDTFDEIEEAPTENYLVRDTVPVEVGARYVVRSVVSACSGLGVPLYGKLEVLAVDPVARTIRLKILVNTNCGYRGLQPGIPED